MVDLHAKAPLVALLGPMHFGMALMMAYRWYLSHFFQANAEQQGGRLFGQLRYAWVKTSDIAICTNVMWGFLHSRVIQSKPLLQKGDTQHDIYGKRQTANGKRQTANGKRRAPTLAACIRREGRTHCNQGCPRSDQAQLIEKYASSQVEIWWWRYSFYFMNL